eukprot:2747412-Pyramimonas_sp.AAC.2
MSSTWKVHVIDFQFYQEKVKIEPTEDTNDGKILRGVKPSHETFKCTGAACDAPTSQLIPREVVLSKWPVINPLVHNTTTDGVPVCGHESRDDTASDRG